MPRKFGQFCLLRFGNPPSGILWEGKSPEIVRFVVMLDKFDSVSAESFRSSQLRNNAGRNLGAPIVLYDDHSANDQVTSQLNNRAMLVQISSLSGHVELTFQAVLARKSNRGAEEHTIASAAECEAPAGGSWLVGVLGFHMAAGVFRIHKDLRHDTDSGCL